MNFFISTATDKIYLILFDENKIIKKVIHQGKNDHTINLYPLLDELNINEDEIEKIFVVNGPGSFTGLRVGVIYARLLARKINKPLFPVNLLELLTNMYEQKIAIDARGKNYYILEDGEITITKNIDDSYLIDPVIDIDKLINNQYLLSIKPINYLNFRIEYVKNPIS